MQKFLIESKETLQFAIDETAATHRMLTQMKGILAIIKHRMNKKNSKHVDCTLANLRLKCEKQISIMVHLLSLHLDKMREEESQYDKVLEYVELWSKNRRGHATIYDRGKAALMSAEMDGSEENGLIIAREVEIEAAVQRLKQLAIEFETEAQAFDAP